MNEFQSQTPGVHWYSMVISMAILSPSALFFIRCGFVHIGMYSIRVNFDVIMSECVCVHSITDSKPSYSYGVDTLNLNVRLCCYNREYFCFKCVFIHSINIYSRLCVQYQLFCMRHTEDAKEVEEKKTENRVYLAQ